MWEYLKLVARQMRALLATGALALIAALNAVFDNVPVISAIHVSPWFWACVAAACLIVAQALAARTLMRGQARTDDQGHRPEIRNYHYGDVHHHHPPGSGDSD